MQSARTGRHHKGRQADLSQQAPQCPGSRTHDLKVIFGGVEIEDHSVGKVQAILSAQPDMGGDTCLIRQVGQSRGIIADHLGQPSPFLLNNHACDPVGIEFRRFLLNEASPETTAYPSGNVVLYHNPLVTLQDEQGEGQSGI
ncbi:MAG: hypothetical protein JWL77_1053 [Chthonomonadaceae bacterium]|nr:hypothetical protein [Chthonomonadaceae bacterium]